MKTKQSKGFGYVNFHNKEEADRCLNTLNNAKFGNKQILLSKKKSKDFDSKANIVVKNLPKEIDQQELYKTFAE